MHRHSTYTRLIALEAKASSLRRRRLIRYPVIDDGDSERLPDPDVLDELREALNTYAPDYYGPIEWNGTFLEAAGLVLWFRKGEWRWHFWPEQLGVSHRPDLSLQFPTSPPQ